VYAILLLGCTDAPGGLAPTLSLDPEIGVVVTASWSRTGPERSRIGDLLAQ